MLIHFCEKMRYMASIDYTIAVWQPLVAQKSCPGKNTEGVLEQPLAPSEDEGKYHGVYFL